MTTHRQSEEDRNGIFFATVLGAIAGTLVGFNSTFVWWQAIIEAIIGFGVHGFIRNRRVHAGSMLLAFVATGLICVAGSSFGIWLRN